jgi:mannose-1-phosphate guanylyltransferase/phosphomannomutase
VTLGRDASRVSRAFKRALVAGLNATGVTCADLELAPAPAVRFSATKAGTSGGVYVRTSPRDSQSIELAIFADDGCDLDEGARRKLERTYNREEFRRAFGREMGELRYPPRALELYTAALLDAIDVRAVRERGFKLVIDAGGGTSLLVLPHLLPRLGLDTLTVNGQFDEARTAMDPGQVRADLERLARLVTASGADLGVRFDPVAERLILVDERGTVLPFDRALLLYIDLVARSDEPGDIALPVSTTRWAAELAAKHGRAVVGTKLAARAVARAAQRDGVVFAGAEGGGYVFPSLHPAYDGLLAFGKLLELLATEETGLSKAVAALPEVGLVRRQIPTPWGRKGAIMRQIVEAAKQRPTDDTDGIKVFHPPKGGSGASRPDDWVLVIPDTVEPVTHLWAESATVADADELADAYEALVRRAAEGE